jgi:DNA repair protein RadC
MATRPSALRAFREALAATSVRSNPAARKRAAESAAGSPAALDALSSALREMARRFLLVEPKDVPDADLVAVLLAGAVEGDPAEASTALLGDVQGNLARVARGEGFARRKGFSDLAFARMTAAAELIKRAERRASVEGLGGQVTGPAEAERIARAYVGGPREQVGALFFDNQLRLLGFRLLSMGGQTMTVADPREVVIAALEMRAKVVILVHNHPSGVPSPSSEDDTTTARLKEILRLLGMQLADHIILGKGGDTYSYAMSMRLNPRRANPRRANPSASENGRYRFVTDCIGSTYEDISALKETGEDVSRTAFARALGPEAWKEIQKELGYGRDFPISRDWHVGYYRGTYRGVPAYYLVWSGIEHIFTLDGKQGHSLARSRR